jgi:membrane protease subunit HflK
VQSAFIGAETSRKEAQAYAETVVPLARAQADATVQAARGEAEANRAAAAGDAAAFLALSREYRANPQVVRERLYRDAVERAVADAGRVRWVPPPNGARYSGFRITLPSGTTATSPSYVDDEP